MPIPVECANCRTKLNAPDAAAGRKVKCPKCQAVLAVPAAAPPPPAGGFDSGGAAADPPRTRDDRPRRPRPRDDDDAADDDRPRRPAGEKKSPLPLILLLGGVGLLTCCGGGGLAVYTAVDRVKEAAARQRAENDAKQKEIDDEIRRRAGAPDVPAPADPPPAVKPAAPPGWVEFNPRDKSFKALFPSTPRDENKTPTTGPKNTTTAVRLFTADDPRGDFTLALRVLKFPAGVPAARREEALAKAAAADLGDPPDPTDVAWLGQRGKEYVVRRPDGGGEVVTRHALVGNTGYVGTVTFKAARRAEVVAAFFDNVEPLSK